MIGGINQYLECGLHAWRHLLEVFSFLLYFLLVNISILLLLFRTAHIRAHFVHAQTQSFAITQFREMIDDTNFSHSLFDRRCWHWTDWRRFHLYFCRKHLLQLNGPDVNRSVSAIFSFLKEKRIIRKYFWRKLKIFERCGLSSESTTITDRLSVVYTRGLTLLTFNLPKLLF